MGRARGRPIGQLLQAVGVEESVQAVVVAAIEASRGPLEAMWEKLGTDGSIPPEAVQQARTGIELGTLTRNHVPLVATLTPRLVSGDLSLRDLAQFLPSDGFQLFPV